MAESKIKDRNNRSIDADHRVTIVIPTYNRVSRLAVCLEALLNQRFTDFDVLVIDDASTDDTAAYLLEFIKTHPEMHLNYIVNEVNRGATVSRNIAIQESSGDIIAFLDSDTIASPSWIGNLTQGFEDGDIAAVMGHVDYPEPRNIFELVMKGSDHVQKSGVVNSLVGCNMAIRKRLLRKYPFEEDIKIYGEDDALSLRLLADGYRFRFVKDAAIVHDHPYTWKTFNARAANGGKAAAWLVYKFQLPHRLDLLPFMLCYASVPLGFIHAYLFLFSIGFLCSGIIALTYNEMVNKHKTVWETLRSIPLLIYYYQIRLFHYLAEYMRLWLLTKDIDRINLGETGRRTNPLTYRLYLLRRKGKTIFERIFGINKAGS